MLSPCDCSRAVEGGVWMGNTFGVFVPQSSQEAGVWSRWMLWVKHPPPHNSQHSQEGLAVTGRSLSLEHRAGSSRTHSPTQTHGPGNKEQQSISGKSQGGKGQGKCQEVAAASAVELHWVTHPGDSTGCPCTSPAGKQLGAGPQPSSGSMSL